MFVAVLYTVVKLETTMTLVFQIMSRKPIIKLYNTLGFDNESNTLSPN